MVNAVPVFRVSMQTSQPRPPCPQPTAPFCVYPNHLRVLPKPNLMIIPLPLISAPTQQICTVSNRRQSLAARSRCFLLPNARMWVHRWKLRQCRCRPSHPPRRPCLQLRCRRCCLASLLLRLHLCPRRYLSCLFSRHLTQVSSRPRVRCRWQSQCQHSRRTSRSPRSTLVLLASSPITQTCHPRRCCESRRCDAKQPCKRCTQMPSRRPWLPRSHSPWRTCLSWTWATEASAALDLDLARPVPVVPVVDGVPTTSDGGPSRLP